MEATGAWMFASVSPGQPITQVLKDVQSSAEICQEQQAAPEPTRRERTDSSSSTPAQITRGREKLNYLLEERIHTGCRSVCASSVEDTEATTIGAYCANGCFPTEHTCPDSEMRFHPLCFRPHREKWHCPMPTGAHVYAPVEQNLDDAIVKSKANGKGKGFSVSGQDKGKSDCEPDSISAMFYQLCTIL